jgi:hypothetical protein
MKSLLGIDVVGSLSLSVAQLEALDFPSSGLGQLGDKFNPAWVFVGRQL